MKGGQNEGARRVRFYVRSQGAAVRQSARVAPDGAGGPRERETAGRRGDPTQLLHNAAPIGPQLRQSRRANAL